MVNYRIELYDRWGRRRAVYNETPLLEAICRTPDAPSHVRGMLPAAPPELGPGGRVRVFIEDRLLLEAEVTQTAPQWGQARKLLLDQYVTFRELYAFSAERPARALNTHLRRAYANREVSAIVRDAINSAPGPVHYLVDHAAYPDGAEREFAKFLARQSPASELEPGGISSGQWVGADRLDASGAYAKDGATIAGVSVDGQPWPDLRLLMCGAESPELDAAAVARHPEVAGWTGALYAASGYKRRADAAIDALNGLLAAHGVDFIELNPHRGATGAYSFRVDAEGRYAGLAYGGGQCFNAALAELGVVDVEMPGGGQALAPEMALKEFFSYTRETAASIETTDTVLAALDVDAGVYEILTALAYAAGGCLWSVSPEGAVSFESAGALRRVLVHDPHRHSLTLGVSGRDLANVLHVEGDPLAAGAAQTYERTPSRTAYGPRERRLEFHPLALEQDAARLADGLLDDLAYPEPSGGLVAHEGAPGVEVGGLLELRGDPLQRLDLPAGGEWGGRFSGRHVVRVREVAHRFTGRHLRTVLRFTSPLRSVADPLQFMVRGQPPSGALYQFRLDDDAVGLDMGYHLA